MWDINKGTVDKVSNVAFAPFIYLRLLSEAELLATKIILDEEATRSSKALSYPVPLPTTPQRRALVSIIIVQIIDK